MQSASSCEAYVRCLRDGCRCIESMCLSFSSSARHHRQSVLNSKHSRSSRFTQNILNSEHSRSNGFAQNQRVRRSVCVAARAWSSEFSACSTRTQPILQV